MRVTAFLVLLLSVGGCGRIGYDPVVEVAPGNDGGDSAPPDGDALPPPDGVVDPTPDGGPEASADVASPGDLMMERPPDVRPPDSGPGDLRPPDTMPDTVGPIDLPPDFPPGCTQPFSNPAPVTIPGVFGDIYAPRLSPDGLTLYFGEQESANPNSVDIYFTTRTAVGAPFTPAQPMAEANSNAEDNGAFLSADQLELFFFSTRAGGAGGRDIWVLRRASVAAGWDAPRPVTELNSTADDYMPSLTGDGLIMFFASDRLPGDADDVWTATRVSRTASFSAPMRVAEVSALPTAATSPFISRDGLTLTYADDRAGGQGLRDLWTTTRSSVTSPFAAPTNLGPQFNSAETDDDPSLSFDGRELLFVTDRVAATSRVYRSIRCP
jgi:hypothetical protein